MLVQGDNETRNVLFGAFVVNRLKFWKTETIGNDFVLFHASDVFPTVSEDRLPLLAQRTCERRFGIGADGMLVVASTGSALHLRMFNPDGTEDFCGNGLRCAASHAVQQGWLSGEFVIEHYGRLVHAVVSPEGRARTSIGPAVTDPESVPLNLEVHPSPLIEEELCGFVGTAVNTGTTHFVTFVDELPSDSVFNKVSPQIELHPIFPERTSVIYAQQTDERSLKIRIWERGVGETLGCGTGSSAAAAELMRKTGRQMTVEVINPGGSLTVSYDEELRSLVTESLPDEPFTGTFVV